MKRILSLLLIMVLVMSQVTIHSYAYENEGFIIENPASFGWSEMVTIKVTVADQVRQAKPNSIGIGLRSLTSDYRRGDLECALVNGQQVYNNYYEGNTMSEHLTSSIQYFNDQGEEIYYGYHVPYAGEKTLEITFAATDYVLDYSDYAIYIGFYTIEEIDQATYNAGPSQGNERVSSGEKYLRIREEAVIGTSLQIAPVDLTYEIPSDIGDARVNISSDENPYGNYFSLDVYGISDSAHNSLNSHLNAREGYKTYKFEHDLYRYSGHDYSQMDEFLDSMARFQYSYLDGHVIEKRVALSSQELEQFGVSRGYKYVGHWQGQEERNDSYFDEVSRQTVHVSHTVDTITYEEVRLLVLPNGLVHKFVFKKYSEFPDAHFSVDERLSNAAYEFDHFMKVLNFVPRNNGMTPKEYGEYVKGDDRLSMSLISNQLTVLNTGVYNTGTKSDSDFHPAIKIQKPDDYSGNLSVHAEIISEDANPPIELINAENPFYTSQTVVDNLLVFDLKTRGVEGGQNSGKIYHPEQKVKFSLRDDQGKAVVKPIFLTVKLVDASPKIIVVEEPGIAQSGSTQAFKIKVDDPDSQTFDIRITSVFGKVRLSNGDFKKVVEKSINLNELIDIGFEAPEIGNFNINKEMEELSMVALQEGTFNTLLADLEGHYLGQFTDKLKDKFNFNNTIYRATRNWDDYDEKIDAISNIKAAQDTYNKWKKVNDAYGHFGNTMNVVNAGLGGEQLGKDIYEATTFENKGVFEASADAGIATISILQTGVGIFGSAVSYVPGGKALSSKTVLWFNLATNVWKGNLQYLSKMEKIDRAEEIQELIPVIIVVTDHTGLSTRFVILIPVKGMEV